MTFTARRLVRRIVLGLAGGLTALGCTNGLEYRLDPAGAGQLSLRFQRPTYLYAVIEHPPTDTSPSGQGPSTDKLPPPGVQVAPTGQMAPTTVQSRLRTLVPQPDIHNGSEYFAAGETAVLGLGLNGRSGLASGPATLTLIAAEVKIDRLAIQLTGGHTPAGVSDPRRVAAMLDRLRDRHPASIQQIASTPDGWTHIFVKQFALDKVVYHRIEVVPKTGSSSGE